jgi:hypothetical protein
VHLRYGSLSGQSVVEFNKATTLAQGDLDAFDDAKALKGEV